nr:MAG TPA: hypothetical protein [Caudoviricetes sp.]
MPCCISFLPKKGYKNNTQPLPDVPLRDTI